MSQYYQQSGYPQYTPPAQPPAQPGASPDVQTAPQPKEPTPLDPPVVYYNKKWRTPPLIVDTQEAADALDPAEWTTNPPPAKTGASDYPKLFFNVNVRPKIVGDADEEKALGGDWRVFDLPQALITAAQAKLDAAQKQ
jgi:hypothetical protein